jgi:ATP adenylyltransferase
MGLDHLWAGWRSSYVGDQVAQRRVDGEVDPTEPTDNLSVFERILQSGAPDDDTFVVARGTWNAVLLNIYPYTSGHLMVLPVRAVGALEDLTDDEHTELWALVRRAVVAVRDAFGCEGVNLGANLGAAAGAGIPGHLHVHVVPRWAGDTNFMTTTAHARVLPLSLDETWRRVRAAWPS